MQRQTSVIYSQDRLAFFGNKELLSAAPVLVEIRETHAILSVGRIHGVKKGAQFATYPPDPDISLTIDWPTTSNVEQSSRQKSRMRYSGVLRFFHAGGAWKEKQWKFLSSRVWEADFRRCYMQAFRTKFLVASRLRKTKTTAPRLPVLRCISEMTRSTSGPVSLVGYEGSVRCLNIKGESDEIRATESALALSHLIRFGQILDLRNKASQDEPFELILNPENNGLNGARFLDNQKFKFTFENRGEVELHFTVLVLSPGFHVKKLHPWPEFLKTVRGSETHTFNIRIKIPDVLKNGPAVNLNQSHRDIFRTVVSTSKEFSVKSLELPDIWNTNQIEYKGRSHLERDAKLLPDTSDVDWWIKDIEIHSISQDSII
ncbi:MAG: hypothetical protein Q9184_003648 [Pyrenodesmia sp. 2 TL-2023]